MTSESGIFTALKSLEYPSDMIANDNYDNTSSACTSTPTTYQDKENSVVYKRRRKHHCAYCDVQVNNFARHLERQHGDELEVGRFLALDKKDPNRKRIINKIRKEGDFISGNCIPVQKRKFDNNKGASSDTLLPCIHCKGYYMKNTLRRHVARCSLNAEKKNNNRRHRHQSDSQTLLAGYFGPNDPLRISGVLQSLKADIVSLVAKRDKIICEVGRRYVKCHKERHLISVAKRYMRRLARIVIEVRKILEDKSLTLASLLHPTKFKYIVIAVKSITNYDAGQKAFGSPSFALQMGTLIKKAIAAYYSLEVQENMNSDKLDELNVMKKLIEEEWAIEISTEAAQNINVKRFNKPTIVPIAEDLAKLKVYLESILSAAKEHLIQNDKNENAFRAIIEAAYCSLLLFNKRRVGELQRIPLDIYERYINEEIESGDFDMLLSPAEKICIKKLKRIVVRGKRGRGVPVLFEKNIKEALDIAVGFRSNFCLANNPYLFSICGTDGPISGYHVFRKHVTKALGDPKKVASLTSTKLRKHLATISQILRMDQEDLEQLASFMGHTTKTHQEWYRLPSDIYQTAKVSKILLMSQKTSIQQYKGKSLSQLDVDDSILELESDNEENVVEDGRPQNWPTTSVATTSTNEQLQIETVSCPRKPKILRKQWSEQEKKLTENFFNDHLRKCRAPRKDEVLSLMQQHPGVFQDRKWDSIKVYICNKYNKNK
ncbi:uncharacterized protein [Leptinotarsa decemlineata]|uniref:uncharacterized protein n=1 Tax=Leptinotarsa decemlineata TaxID=7539 RepID=UPI003D307A97